MKKTISVLLAIMMIMLSLLPTMVLAEERDKTYDVTLGEIQQELIDYASIAGSKIVPGTDSYYDYVVPAFESFRSKTVRASTLRFDPCLHGRI